MTAIIILLIFAPLAAGTWRKWSSHLLLWCVAASALVAVLIAGLGLQRSVTLIQSNGTGLDTVYYQVSNRAWILDGVAIPALLGVLHWAQNRWARALTYWGQVSLLWVYAVSVFGPALNTWPRSFVPNTYADYAEALRFLQITDTIANACALLSLALLITLPLLSLLLRRNRGPTRFF